MPTGKHHIELNKDGQTSVTYSKCQQNLLQADIYNKKSCLRTLQNEFNCLRNDLYFSLSCIDFAHISPIFGVAMILLSKLMIPFDRKSLISF